MYNTLRKNNFSPLQRVCLFCVLVRMCVSACLSVKVEEGLEMPQVHVSFMDSHSLYMNGHILFHH